MARIAGVFSVYTVGYSDMHFNSLFADQYN